MESTAPCEGRDGVDVDVKIERTVKEADAGSAMQRCRCDGGWRGVKDVLGRRVDCFRYRFGWDWRADRHADFSQIQGPRR